MSVVMEGKLAGADAAEDGAGLSESSLDFSGSWHFIKEQAKRTLNFRYKRVSDTVPRDLLNFVSFINTNQRPQPTSSSKKGTKNKKGSSSSSSTSAPSAGEGRDRQGTEAGADDSMEMETAIAEASSESVEKAVGTEAVEDEEGKAPEKMEESQIETEDATFASTFSAAAEEKPADANVVERPTGPVKLSSSHPLFGLWQGSFDVVVLPSGTEADVAETFFFHSFIGAEVQKELADLPQEAYFSLSVLKAAPVPLLPRRHKSSIQSQDGNGAIVDGSSSSSSHSMEVVGDQGSSSGSGGGEEHATASATDLANEITTAPGTVPTPAADSESGTTVAADATATAPAPATVTATTTTSVSGNDFSLELPAAPSESEPDATQAGEDPVVLVGFGRNKFGRFSLTGSYHASTGTLICEKRYMLTKSATSKRSKRAEVMDDLLLPRDGAGGRSRVNSTLDPLDDDFGAGAAKRKRVSKGYSGYAFEDYALAPPEPRPKKASLGGGANFYGGDVGAGGMNGYADDDDEEYKSAFYDDATGEVYEGGWYLGRRHGRGLCLYIDGTMYEGLWNMGKEQGRGQLLSGDRQVICVGDWMDGLMHGHGTFNYATGNCYTGDFREGNRHGKGEMLMTDGCRYIGDWKDNKRCGRGLFTWPDGSFYDGEWENDCRHGKGLLELTNGFRYDGYWFANHLDGRGTCTFKSGQEYQGSYKAGLREGRGSITFPEGAIYEGRFRDDRIDGQGTIKVYDTVAGHEEGERLIPIDIQADLKRLHLKAGFGPGHH